MECEPEPAEPAELVFIEDEPQPEPEPEPTPEPQPDPEPQPEQHELSDTDRLEAILSTLCCPFCEKKSGGKKHYKSRSTFKKHLRKFHSDIISFPEQPQPQTQTQTQPERPIEFYFEDPEQEQDAHPPPPPDEPPRFLFPEAEINEEKQRELLLSKLHSLEQNSDYICPLPKTANIQAIRKELEAQKDRLEIKKNTGIIMRGFYSLVYAGEQFWEGSIMYVNKTRIRLGNLTENLMTQNKEVESALMEGLQSNETARSVLSHIANPWARLGLVVGNTAISTHAENCRALESST